jgi:Arc/MetJ family transcription regulator
MSAVIHIESTMRTNIDIDDALLAEAMAAAGLTTKRATVDEALRRLVRQHRRRKAIEDMAGLGWEGDLEASREGRLNEPHS